MQAPAPTRPDTLPRLSIARKPQSRFLTLTHARRDSGKKRTLGSRGMKFFLSLFLATKVSLESVEQC